MPAWKKTWTAVAALGWAAAVTGVVWWDRSAATHRGWVLLIIAASTVTILTTQLHLHERRLAAFEFGRAARRCPFEDEELAVLRTTPNRGQTTT